MKDIHEQWIQHGTSKDYINYVKRANISGFNKDADSMIDQGVV